MLSDNYSYELLPGLNINPIPLEFAQKMTTTEWLCYMQSVINKCIDKVNSYEQSNAEYVDQKYAELSTGLIMKIDSVSSAVDAALVSSKQYTDTELDSRSSDLEAAIADAEQDITDAYKDDDASLEQEITEKYEILKELIDLCNALILDPTTGNEVSTQEAIDSLYEYMRDSALTAEEYDALGLTAANYEAKAITAREYDMYGYQYLMNESVSTASVTFGTDEDITSMFEGR